MPKEIVTILTEDETRQVLISAEFDTMMATGFAQAKAGHGRSVADVKNDLRRKIREWSK